MQAIQCEICGSNDIVKQNGLFISDGGYTGKKELMTIDARENMKVTRIIDTTVCDVTKHPILASAPYHLLTLTFLCTGSKNFEYYGFTRLLKNGNIYMFDI